MAPTTFFAPRTVRAERRLWVLLSALFSLVAGVNAVLALREAEWWQGGVAALAAFAAVGCLKVRG
ncbi:hypothetical protein [Saccharothrix obliqua]|uniref:hypothetical protein n=1 Tax=Saccharothrix obliqua TaxID=2861747 RepID=UPI001C5D2E36|nr:hypothetical protein [Saccharothrix obliqua]MBW4721290.1 hypothetical protein [Saccharothrix obliqua]